MKESVGQVTISMLVFFVVFLISIFFDGAYGSPDFDFNVASKSAAILEKQVELSISLKNIPGQVLVNYSSRCDVYTRPKNSEKWTKYDRTEYHPKNTNPVFADRIRIPYLLGDQGAELKFEIVRRYDKPERHFVTGFATCELAELLSAGRIQTPLKLGNNKENLGYIIVKAEQFDYPYNYDTVLMKVNGKDLKHKHMFKIPRNSLEIYKRVVSDNKEGDSSNNEDDYTIVFRTNVTTLQISERTPFIIDYPDPYWDEITVPFNTFCDGEWDRELKFVCRDGHRIVGEFRSTAKKIHSRGPKEKFTLIDEREKTAGKIIIENFEVVSVPSFSKFMEHGLQLEITIAIDFSKINNGPLETVGSFHHRDEKSDNRYEKAIRLVIGALQDYVWNNQYDVRGFGLGNENGRIHDYELGRAEGVDQVLDLYRNAFTKIRMGSKADLGPLVWRLSETAKDYKGSSVDKYHVLVVLMAGEIANNWVLKPCWYKVLPVPFSIIFVGIDDTHFTEVKLGYQELMTHQPQYPYSRNFLHFMSLHDYDPLDDGSRRYREVELLAKVPEQVVTYMRMKKVKS